MLRVRKKILPFIYTQELPPSATVTKQRVRVQVNFIFFFPVWMGNLQDDPQWPSPGTHTWAILLTM